MSEFAEILEVVLHSQLWELVFPGRKAEEKPTLYVWTMSGYKRVTDPFLVELAWIVWQVRNS